MAAGAISWLVPPVAAWPVLAPLATALLVLLVRVRVAVQWIGVAGSVATLAAGAALPWLRPADRLAGLTAPLVAMVGVAVALAMPGWIAREIAAFRLAALHVPRVLAITQAMLAGGMLAVVAPDPVAAWAGVVALSLALLLPLALAEAPAARTRGRALLGVAAIGLVVAMAGCAALLLAFPGAEPGWRPARLPAARVDGGLAWLGAGCLALGLAVLGGMAVLAGRENATPAGGLGGFAVLLPLLVLALRLPASATVAGLGVAVLLAAAWLAARADAVDRWVEGATLAQAGIVVLLAGLGTPSAAFAALAVLLLLVLTRVALLPDMAGLLALAGVPPFGLFAGVYLALSALAGVSVLLTAAVVVALLLPLWRLARIGSPLAMGGWRALPGWLMLALGGVLGLAMPAPLARWLALVAADLP